MRTQPIFNSVVPVSEDPDLAIAVPPPSRLPAFPRLVETASEALWSILLLLVIGFFLSKAPVISAVFDEAAGAFHRSGEPALHANDAQIEDLDLRMRSDERKLRMLERGYEQLKQRHDDLLRAYAQLLETRKPPASGIVPQVVARSRDLRPLTGR